MKRPVPFAILILNTVKPKSSKELDPYIVALEREANEERDQDIAVRCLRSAIILEQFRRRLVAREERQIYAQK